MPHPAIVLISEHHADTLTDQFSRYAREYDVRTCRSAHEAHECMRELRDAGVQVALFVVESVLPDATVYEAVAKMRKVVPTARRVVVSHWERFGSDAPGLRPGMALGSTTRSCSSPAASATRSSTPRSSSCSATGAPPSPPPRSTRSASSRRRTTR